MKKKVEQKPSAHDLEVWEYAEQELFDYLYKGIAGWFQILGHRLIGRWSKKYGNNYVVEIGSGQGHHVLYSGHEYENYIGLDHRFEYIQALKDRHSSAKAVNGDAFRLPFAERSVECVISVYILEHLKDLKKSLLEIKRILKPGGSLLIGLPAEGGLLYTIGRNLTSKPYMEKKYGFNYDAIVKYEHVNDYPKVIQVLKQVFPHFRKTFLPFPFLPTHQLNAVVCLNVRNEG